MNQTSGGREVCLYTIGFSKKSARQFFELLHEHHVRRVVDVRLFNRSQLAGFTKAADLPYFLDTILGVSYTHCLEFAPTKQLLDDYKSSRITWEQYERQYQTLLAEREPAQGLPAELIDQSCLLCSESDAARCHRRLAAEYLQRVYRQTHSIDVIHL